MEKQKYFQEISKLARENREKGKYSTEELNAYIEGQKNAFRSCLSMLHPSSSDIYENLTYTQHELEDFCKKNIQDLRQRLQRARHIYKSQIKLIQDLTQLSID